MDIGVGLGNSRGQAPLRDDLDRLVTRLGQLVTWARTPAARAGHGRLAADGPVGCTPPAAGNVLLAGDAAGLINPLQGEGIGPAMVSARLAARPCWPAGPGAAVYAEAIEAAFGQYMAGASALQRVLLGKPRTASAVTRLLPPRSSGGPSRVPGRSTGTG